MPLNQHTCGIEIRVLDERGRIADPAPVFCVATRRAKIRKGDWTRRKLPWSDASPSGARLDASPRAHGSRRSHTGTARVLAIDADAASSDGRDGECQADHHESLIRMLL